MRFPWLLALALFACPPPPVAGPDGSVPVDDAGTTAPIDAGTDDAGQPLPPFDAGVRPAGPVPGEVTVWQLDLAPGLVPKTGEAAIVIGPDGTLVVIDVGNSNHDDELRTALRELNTTWLTAARGYRARAPLEVEWVLLTHFHADHIGGFEPLTSGADAIVPTRGVVHRGFVDVGPAVNEADFEQVCLRLRGTLAAKNFGLCAAAPESPCVIGPRSPATGCPGLTLGDLGSPTDDASGDPSFIPLGGGARLDLLGSNGFMLQGRTPVAASAFGVTDVNEENARSVVGLVRHGAFRFLFAGDLSGSGLPTEPDLESFLVNSQPQVFGALGIDVTHANHHARKTSSNSNYVQAAAPNDGRTRSVVAGINEAYVNSPHQETLDAWTAGGRLGAGRLFVTKRALAGANGAGLVDVNGRVVVQTVEQGGGYWVQGQATPSLRR